MAEIAGASAGGELRRAEFETVVPSDITPWKGSPWQGAAHAGWQ